MMSQILDISSETKRKKPSLFSRITDKILSLFPKLLKKNLRSYAANLASEKIIKYIVDELKSAGFIEGSKQETESKEKIKKTTNCQENL